ncbi:MAG: xanthine dehydrogenase family protein subunit M [SAR324 cluster bacterium]|nr:xanthine dehydrogenase family protein subunit M [SAR324 cluster bacterium]
MKPSPFTYHDPHSLDEALALLNQYGEEARIIAGGQSLVAMMNLRLAQPDHLIDINNIPVLNGIECQDRLLQIGALTSHQDILQSELVRQSCPILTNAAAHIGHYAIRQRGTIGGSLSHADPAAEWPMIAILLDGEMEIAQLSGEKRTLGARDFIQSIYTTDLAPEEILTKISFPCLEENEGWAFKPFARRRGDYFIVAVAACLTLDQSGRIKRLRLCLGGMEATAIRLDEIEQGSIAHLPDENWIREVAKAACNEGNPVDDHNADVEYRRELVEILVTDALQDAFKGTQRG